MLAAGTRFGPYEIVSAIGAGGMGEVYRARDSRLQRTVALKVLSGKLASSPELLARFEQEARAIAALQDPHICVLHDIGREGDAPYLVMEFLEGETLAARLRRGPLPLAEIISVGAAIAAALERAHRAGIVHRDLKPGNVMLTKSGAKLLDFGLAKSASSSVFDATTLGIGATSPPGPHAPVTQPGAVLGTLAYMSPEQMEGREADARSDIYAFGCVLYEMASGKPAYAGVQPVAPPALDRLVHDCLERDPEARLQSAHDAALMLRAIAAAPAAAPPPRPGWRMALGWAVAAAVIVAAAATVWALRRPASGPRTVTEIAPPPGTHFVFDGNYAGPPVISPNGREVVFTAATSSGSRALWLRPIGQLQAHELPGTEGGFFPFWSPDSRSIGYFANYHLMVLSLDGGLPRALAATTAARGGTWTAGGAPGGTIVFEPTVTSGLMRISASGGAMRPITKAPAAPYSSFRFPYFLPGGKALIYLAMSPDDPGSDMLYFTSLDGKTSHPLVHSLTGGIYAGGRLLYSVNGTLMAQPMNAASGTLSGTAQPVASGIYEDTVTRRPAYSASANGVLLYATGAAGPEQLSWVGRDGKPLGVPLPPFDGVVSTAAVSPDGRRIAMSLDNGTPDIWTESAAGGTPVRLTFGPVNNQFPVWSPDGKWIAYFTYQHGGFAIARRPAVGGAEQMLGAAKVSVSEAPQAWSPDGREILCVGASGAIDVFPVAGGPARTLATIHNPGVNSEGIFYATISPDGRWVSYPAGDPGQAPKLYVMPFHGPAGTVWQATSEGVTQAFWVRDGRELDVVDASDRLLAIPVSASGNVPSFGAPQVLATHVPMLVAASPDGQRFLALSHPSDTQRVVVVAPWH